MKPTFLIYPVLLLTQSSCIWQLHDVFVRDSYPGELPPAVILDINGQPAHQNWLQADPEALPAPQALISNRSNNHASDGTPYGYSSEFSDITISPYSPYPQLSYKGISGGAKVWDPYSRKPFIIPRVHTIN